MKGGYITSYTKLYFTPPDPKPEDIRINRFHVEDRVEKWYTYM